VREKIGKDRQGEKYEKGGRRNRGDRVKGRERENIKI
jgi:hypothetical protein